jgi:hypothetical protein
VSRAEVMVRPRPAEYNIDRVARDPRRGQYKSYGPPYTKLCKEVGTAVLNYKIELHSK